MAAIVRDGWSVVRATSTSLKSFLRRSVTQIHNLSLSCYHKFVESDVHGVGPLGWFDLPVGGGGCVDRVVVGGGCDLLTYRIQSCSHYQNFVRHLFCVKLINSIGP